MRFAGRAAVAVALGLGAVGVLPAAAEDLGLGWEGEVTDPGLRAGAAVRGEALVVPVRFEYQGPPGSTITELALELSPVDDRCDDDVRVVQPLGEGDGNGVSPTVPPPPEGGPTVAEWTFTLDPGCNGTYDLSVVATVDPRGLGRAGDAGSTSEPLELRGLQVSLLPPAPTGVQATPSPDGAVTVRWSAPAAWADGPPVDAAGYRVERAAPGGDFAPVAEVGLHATHAVDRPGAGGRYRYRVVAVRSDANGRAVVSPPGEVAVDVAGPPASTGTAPGLPPAGAFGAAAGTGAQAVPPPPPPPAPLDTGYEEVLDYGELGAPDAVPPGDAHLLDLVDEEPPGAGILIPAAIALCIAVWGLHARHLARRAGPTT